MARRWFKWTVEFKVDASWVADGFDLTDERAHDMLTGTLPWAYNSELGAKVLQAPPRDAIRKLQGYPVGEPAGKRHVDVAFSERRPEHSSRKGGSRGAR